MPVHVYTNTDSCAKSAADYNITLGWPEANGKKALSYQKQRHEAEVELGRKIPEIFLVLFAPDLYVSHFEQLTARATCAHCFYMNVNTNKTWKVSLMHFSAADKE